MVLSPVEGVYGAISEALCTGSVGSLSKRLISSEKRNFQKIIILVTSWYIVEASVVKLSRNQLVD